MRIPPVNLGNDNTFGRIVYNEGGSYGPVRGPYLAFLYIETGHGRILADGNAVELSAGECALTLSTHSYSYSAPPSKRSVVFWTDCRIEDNSQIWNDLRSGPAKIAASDTIQALIKTGVSIQTDTSSGAEHLIEAVTRTLLQAYFYEAGTLVYHGRVPEVIQTAKRRLSESLAVDVTIAEIAKELGITPQYLVTSFNKFFGETPGEYLWKLRLNNGLLLIKRTNLSIAEIAYQCGFKNPFHFSRKFKAWKGHSPTELRKAIQDNDQRRVS
ncbi:AraC family transcriptional regulator [Ruegeria sp. Ofav3-42]|uniref:AraC family transcriptional regulator n=1 Tax=Ruegeria sp. Ofav3-42 TaxID=2917759 RepID=UPI001EF6DD5A|nr:AraC family transcriptional regulator [Ruegeria sp. Ofav3-42]MCG7522540.1 AraC family transcriptional regulator [Ruegeria sp. Ofav3-42]